MTSTARRSPFALFANPEFAALAGTRFAGGATLATVVIALALYADAFSASGVVAGLFMAAYASIRLLLVLPLGRVIDTGDSRRYVLAGLVLSGIVLVGFVFVDSAAHVIGLRAVQGVAAVVTLLAGTATVGEIAPDGERGQWIGTFNQVQAFAGLAGDLVGGALLFLYGFTATYLVLLAVTVASTIAVLAYVRVDPGDDRDVVDGTGVEVLRRLLARRAIQALVAFRFAFSFAKMAVVLFLPVYARTEFGMSAFAIGAVLAGGRITMSVSQGYVGRLSDRVGRVSWFIVAGTVLYAVGIAIIPFASHAAGIVDPIVLSGFGRRIEVSGPFFVLFFAYLVLSVADSLRIPTSVTLFVEEGRHFGAVAGSLSLRSVSWQVGAIVGPIAVGGVLDVASFAAAFWLAASLAFVAGVLFALLYESEPPPES